MVSQHNRRARRPLCGLPVRRELLRWRLLGERPIVGLGAFNGGFWKGLAMHADSVLCYPCAKCQKGGNAMCASRMTTGLSARYIMTCLQKCVYCKARGFARTEHELEILRGA